MAFEYVDNFREQGARKRLVNYLKEEKKISDTLVLEAIAQVPRHYFFDKTFWGQAYKDIAFPIGEGQTISQPFTVAYQSQLLHIEKGQKVLEIGTGCGYQTCVLSQMGAQVFTIERIQSLYERTSQLLPRLGYQAHFFCGDGSLGLPSCAPFDKILVTAGAPYVPEKLLQQLSIGGLLVIPVGDEKSQKMHTVLRIGDNEFEQMELEVFRFVPLLGDQAW